jgi:hypothetical protein
MKTTVINTITFELTKEEMLVLLKMVGATSYRERTDLYGMTEMENELAYEIYSSAMTTIKGGNYE